MSQADRLKKIIDYLIETPNSFSKEIGLSTPTTIYDVIAGKRAITQALLKRVVSNYPNLNPEWLLNGTGEMIITKGRPIEKVKDEKAKNEQECQACKDKDLIIEKYEKIIQQQTELIDQLTKLKNKDE